MASQTDSSADQPPSETPRVSSLGERTSLGKYEIHRELGTGGMGTVYLAVDTKLKRTVALKVLPKERTQNDTLVRRFQAEALAAAQLKHENIVTIYDAGQTEGHLFIALEYVDGGDVYELVSKRGPLPLKRSIDLIKQVTHALDHMHKRGFVHRDIKPSNLLLTKDKVVKLTDMGLARTVDESLQTGITREGTTVGTVDYMAPEQARNSQAADIRSDIYSLGCAWYQMLTGEPPYPTGSTTNKLFAHISKPRPDPRELNRAIPDEIVSIMHRMMARKPDDRYQTPAELLQELDDFSAGKSRLDEVLGAEAETTSDSSWPATPSRGVPLPPRHSPSPSVERPRSPATDKTHAPRTPERIPAARGRAGEEPPQPAIDTPPPSAPRPRADDGSSDAIVARKSTPSQPDAPAQRTRELAAQPVARPPAAEPRASGPPVARRPVTMPPMAMPRTAAPPVAKMPARVAPRSNQESSEDLQIESVDWSGLAIKVAQLLGGVAALGLVVWLCVWLFGRSNDQVVHHDLMRNPFQRQADIQAAADSGTDKDASGKSDKPEDTKATPPPKDPKDKDAKSVVLAKAKPPAEDKPVENPTVLGRPDERREFPAWIAELWNPDTASASKDWAKLKTLTVGRIDASPADAPSIAAAIEQLPEEGGIIVLRGPGPFVTPPLKIANHRQVIISGVMPKQTAPAAGPAAAVNKATAEIAQPLVTVVPSAGPKSEAAIRATNSSLTIYGVHLTVMSDAFAADSAVRLIDVRSGDLTMQKSSLTLLGHRNSSTAAVSVLSPAGDRPARVLLDRILVRGNDVTAVDLDASSIDLLAINSLFISGDAPAVRLQGGGNREVAATDKPVIQRNLRLFSCTTCGTSAAVVLQGDSDRAAPPLTQFRVLNSVCAVVYRPQATSMISLVRWPFRRKTPEHPASVDNLKWSSESFTACGWEKLVQADANTLFGTNDDGAWATFWGVLGSSVDYNPAPFPAEEGLASVPLSRFKPEAFPRRRGTLATELPGCDPAWFRLPSAEVVRRAEAFVQRPSVPAELLETSLADWTVRDVSLDNDKRPEWENLAKTISSVQWQSRTIFRIHGTGKKVCGPIHVVNKSLCIDFVDENPPQLSFEDPGGQLRGGQKALISVEGGTILIEHANFRIEPTTKRGASCLLAVRDGSLAIENSRIEGPTHESPGYEGLVHLSNRTSGTGESGGPERYFAYIGDSFLSTPENIIASDVARRDLIVENSILAADGNVFELRFGSASTLPPAIDLRSSTLAAGSQYFHFNPSTAPTPEHVRIFAENTIFAPPIDAARHGSVAPLLFAGVQGDAIPRQVDWWEYACAYSSLLKLPAAAASKASDSLSKWKELAGPLHIVRSIADANAVLFPRELPHSRDLVYADFELKNEAAAARWSDVGKAIGAKPSVVRLALPPKRSAAHEHEPAGRKPATSKTSKLPKKSTIKPAEPSGL